jgi:Cu(I)/Ag(I) efflux system membrane fusion protein
MKLKRWLNLILVSIVLSVGTIAFIGCSSDQPAKSEKAAQYTCPMHPEVVKDKPGDCPKCGMKLVEKK